MRKITGLLAALVLAAASLAPSAADARDRRHHGGHYSDGYYDRHDYYRDRDHGDAVAAGVVGLVLGLAIGSLASQPREPGCADNYRRCPPPQGYYGPGGGDPRYVDPRDRDQGYYRDDDQLEGGYDPRYDDPHAAYERDYGMAPGGGYERRDTPQCMRRERQWDRYAQRYVVVDVPC